MTDPRTALLAVACLLAALGACSGGAAEEAPAAPQPPRCTPGGDGTIPEDLHEDLDAFCMVHIEGGKVIPEPGVVAYELNSPLFSDYAVKHRTVWIPPGTRIKYAPDKLDFPVGTIITKSFGYPADFRVQGAPVRWYETRVMARAEDGWRAVSYLWDEAQKKATRKASGKILDVDWIDQDGASQRSTYLIPSSNQCKKCHAEDGVLAILGPHPAQLNRDIDAPGGRVNQLARWASLGLFDGAPAPEQAPRLLAWDDPASGSVEQRARAYLDANCGYCHNPHGDARTSGLMLTFDVTEPYKLGVCKTPVAAGKAAANLFHDIVPGAPDKSILIFRMESTLPSVMMPEIGRSLAHKEAIALVRQWIEGLSGSCSAP